MMKTSPRTELRYFTEHSSTAHAATVRQSWERSAPWITPWAASGSCRISRPWTLFLLWELTAECAFCCAYQLDLRRCSIARGTGLAEWHHFAGPIEAYDAEYEAIRLATALGIIVIEAGGNGTNNGSTPPLNMDTYTTLGGQAILNRDPANPDFRDSGAIIVTAATSAAPHTRLAYAPHGRRIDCYAWGQNINTLASDSGGSTNSYTSLFSGTSGASPIVTGAALAVQGRAEALLGFRFGPR